MVLKSVPPVLTYQLPNQLFQMLINLVFPQACQPNTFKKTWNNPYLPFPAHLIESISSNLPSKRFILESLLFLTIHTQILSIFFQKYIQNMAILPHFPISTAWFNSASYDFYPRLTTQCPSWSLSPSFSSIIHFYPPAMIIFLSNKYDYARLSFSLSPPFNNFSLFPTSCPIKAKFFCLSTVLHDVTLIYSSNFISFYSPPQS